jgi:ATP-dependent Clp protease ATP-binding subunit ClpA
MVISPDLNKAFVEAEKIMKTMNDAYVTTEHLLLAILAGNSDTKHALHSD